MQSADLPIAPAQRQRRQMLAGHDAFGTDPIERRPSRIVERTQRAGEIVERRGLLARRSAKRARRLALEVDDHQVILDDEHLAKVVVAVNARLGARRGQSARAGPALGRSCRTRIRSSSTHWACAGRRAPCRRARAEPRKASSASARVCATHRLMSSAVMGSGAKAGSTVGVASAMCRSAVRRPSFLPISTGNASFGNSLSDGCKAVLL